MNLFKKKKAKYHKLDRGLLAEAITIYSNNIDLKSVCNCVSHVNEAIRLNDVLVLKIPYLHHHLGAYSHFYSMEVKTYVEGIQMAEYQFELDMGLDSRIYRRWDCSNKKIIHYMPNQFIDLMNDWSNKVVTEFHTKQTQKMSAQEKAAQQVYSNEEKVLDKYR